MDPALVEQTGYIVGGLVGGIAIIATTFVVLLCFPSIREAFTERIRQRALRQADATDIVAQLAGLRGEVYALRSELAQARGLPAVQGDHAHLMDSTRRDRAISS